MCAKLEEAQAHPRCIANLGTHMCVPKHAEGGQRARKEREGGKEAGGERGGKPINVAQNAHDQRRGLQRYINFAHGPPGWRVLETRRATATRNAKARPCTCSVPHAMHVTAPTACAVRALAVTIGKRGGETDERRTSKGDKQEWLGKHTAHTHLYQKKL